MAAFFINRPGEAEEAGSEQTVQAPQPEQPDTQPKTTVPDQTAEDCLTYQGTDYPMKKHLWSVLLIGTDDTESYVELPDNERDFRSYHQADFLMLLVLDKDANTAEIIQLNRDTMTDVPWLDIFGEFGGTEFKQLCRAFNYGDGGISSCRNTVRAVSGMLFDAPIDGYIQIPMTAIPALNDLVGGVPVTVREDLTLLDPAFTVGAEITLKGIQAEKFVRARIDLEDDTNIARMRRHRDYMESFQKRAKEAVASDSSFLKGMIKGMSGFLQTNLSGEQLLNLVEQLDASRVSPIRAASGELTVGEKYYEFYADEDSLWEIVHNAYCQ